MSWLNLLGIAIGLAMDAFAVSIAAGVILDRITPRHVFRLAFHFGLFQFMMPILGWLAGSSVDRYVAGFDHWLVFGLLSFVGGKMLLEAWSRQEDRVRSDPTRGLMLVTLSVATSIDALAVGLSMAFLRVSIWLPCVVIGVVAAAFTAVGIMFSRRLLGRWGRKAEAFGGLVLLAIGVRVLASHLAA